MLQKWWGGGHGLRCPGCGRTVPEGGWVDVDDAAKGHRVLCLPCAGYDANGRRPGDQGQLFEVREQRGLFGG